MWRFERARTDLRIAFSAAESLAHKFWKSSFLVRNFFLLHFFSFEEDSLLPDFGQYDKRI